MEKGIKEEAVKRLNYIEGHLAGVRKMVEEGRYCVDVLKQTFAIRKSLEKLDSLMLAGHLRNCVPEGMRNGGEEQVVSELIELYNLAEK